MLGIFSPQWLIMPRIEASTMVFVIPALVIILNALVFSVGSDLDGSGVVRLDSLGSGFGTVGVFSDFRESLKLKKAG